MAKKISELSMAGKIRLASVGNSFARSVLIRDSNRVVAMAAIQSPLMNDNEVVRHAANRGLSEDILAEYIAWLERDVGVTTNQSALNQVVGGGAGDGTN